MMQTLFGVDVSHALPGFDLIVTNDCYSPIHLRGVAPLGPISSSYAVDLTTWKFWKNVVPTSAQVILAGFGFSSNDSQPTCPYVDMTPYPALLVNTPGAGRGRTAVNPFALGDTGKWSGTEASSWDIRYAVLRSIYRDYFGLQPALDLTGSGSEHVLPMYRICTNGSVLIALLNEDTNTAFLTLAAPTLLRGLTIEDLSMGGVLARNSTGSLTYTNKGDDCIILYAYKSNGPQDDSLINPQSSKLWFDNAPLAVWPTGAPASVRIGYDTQETNMILRVSLEQVSPQPSVFGCSALSSVTGHGSLVVSVPVPDADANNPTYVSSHQGAQYMFHASLLQGSSQVSDVKLPVRLLFGIYPTNPLPSNLVPGYVYQVPLGWEELPSYLLPDTPLDRAAMWDSLDLGREHYRVVLELNSSSLVLASNSFLTSAGTSNHTFTATVPAGSVGPYTWTAYLQATTNVLSHNVEQSFEGYRRGARWQGPDLPFLTNVNFFAPWTSYVYGYPDGATIWLNEGVHLLGSDGAQSAFMVVSNSPSLVYGGFGLIYEFTNGDWALPADRNQWTNYIFAYDFMEKNGNRASVDMQVKDVSNNWIQYTNLFNQPSNTWFSIRASLDRFQAPPPGVTGPFDPQHVHAIVINIQMFSTGALYVGSFDNIRFLGPEVDYGGGPTTSVYTSANDSLGWLSIKPGPSGPLVSWIGDGILQDAQKAIGPWCDITNASNPYPVRPGLSQQFFRLRR